MSNRPSTSAVDDAEVQIEVVIQEFSARLSQFQFEKALEYVEEVRRRPTSNKTSLWISIFNTLVQLTSAESQYFGLSFFASKFSFRKRNLRDSYQQIGIELEKCLDVWKLEPKEPTVIDFVLPFLRQFIALVNGRVEMVDFYIATSASSWQTNCKEALGRLETINEHLSTGNWNVIRMPQFANLCTEVAVLRKSFKIDDELLDVSMLDTVLRMKSLRAEITDWLSYATYQEESTKRSFFSFNLANKSKTTSKLSLVRWFFYFFNHLMAKINLYYHLSMTSSDPTHELRHSFSNTPISFLHSFHLFARRCNPQLSVLIMNRLELNDPFFGFRYHRFLAKYGPDYCEPITGINGKYPPLAYFPPEKSAFDRYHPSITSLIQDLCCRGDSDFKVKYLYDNRSDETFFTVLVQKRIHLTVVFDRKIGEKEPGVVAFFNDILAHLRGQLLMHELSVK